jgi:glutathione synthase/RimK-type ligase-like ATP-grasp enzyme
MTRIAIHHTEGSFSDRWMEYCGAHGIPYEVTSAYDSDILRRLAAFDAFLWHWSHGVPQDLLMARHVIMAAERMGLAVFPNTATCWHFDDKVAQKYLLEAVGAPLVPTWVFYDLDTALAWIDGATFPKVFKLRRGAGSRNVRLVQTASEARRLAKKAFGRGYKPLGPYLGDAPTRIRKAQRRGDVCGALKRVPRGLLAMYRSNFQIGREKGYAYFQDFAPGNRFDTRVTVVGRRAFGFTRNVRPNDFRASGSGSIDYDTKRIDPRCVSIAFDVTAKVGAQSLAFDFVAGGTGGPVIVEVSYAYLASAVHDCAGHWDPELGWVEGHVWPQDAILEDLLAGVGAEATSRRGQAR